MHNNQNNQKNQNERIKDLPKELRPYEKCEAFGAERLTDAELLAVLLRSGSREKNSLRLAEELLHLNGRENGLLELLQYGLEDLLSVKGIGRVKAMQLLCAAELSRRIWKQTAVRRLDLKSAASVADYYMEELRHLDYECVYLMLLDQRDNLRKSMRISQGSMFGSALSPREVFKAAIRHRACGMLLVHNHPSGDPTPSRDDRRMTQQLRRAGEELGILLRDHVIIGDCCYFSFAEQGML